MPRRRNRNQRLRHSKHMWRSAEEKKAIHYEQVKKWKQEHKDRPRDYRLRHYGQLDESKALPRLHQSLKGWSEEAKKQRAREQNKQWRKDHPEMVRQYYEAAKQRQRDAKLHLQPDGNVS